MDRRQASNMTLVLPGLKRKYFLPVLMVFMASAFIVMPSSGFASTILVDYGDLAATPTLGGTWNEVATTTTTGMALVDTTGVATGVTLSVTITGSNTFEFNQGAWALSDVGWIDADATADVFGFNGVSNVTFTGLAANMLYTIDHLSARNVPAISDYTINGNFADSTPNGDNWNNQADGYLGGNYLTWYNILPDESGQIQLDIFPNPWFGYLSATRITPATIPEPSTITLLGIGLVGLAGAEIRRRRKKKAHV